MRAVFVDRDGVINRNRGNHVRSWAEFVFLPRAVDALAELTRHDLPVVVLTNQAAVNRGIIPKAALEDIHSRMVSTLAEAGARIEEVFYCPHRPDELCGCRKPQPGLLLKASDKLGIELSQSYLIGDAMTDIAAGLAVGCRTILVMTGRGLFEYLTPAARRCHGYAVSWDIHGAVKRILIWEGL